MYLPKYSFWQIYWSVIFIVKKFTNHIYQYFLLLQIFADEIYQYVLRLETIILQRKNNQNFNHEKYF